MTFEQTAVEDACLSPSTYDVIFAINVNTFWTAPDAALLARLRDALRPGGRLALFYEPPTPDRIPAIEARLRRTLETATMTVVASRQALGRSELLAVEGTPADQH